MPQFFLFSRVAAGWLDVSVTASCQMWQAKKKKAVIQSFIFPKGSLNPTGFLPCLGFYFRKETLREGFREITAAMPRQATGKAARILEMPNAAPSAVAVFELLTVGICSFLEAFLATVGDIARLPGKILMLKTLSEQISLSLAPGCIQGKDLSV